MKSPKPFLLCGLVLSLAAVAGCSKSPKPSSQEPHDCPQGQHLVNGACVADVPTCPQGQHLVNGSCVADVPTCPEGQHLVNGSCVADVPTCPQGQHLENGSCVADVPTCPEGQHLENGSCVADVPTCPEGTHLVGSECVVSTVATTLIVTVVNEGGGPVEGATVTAHGHTGKTDRHGVFQFDNLTVPTDRCVATARAEGKLLAAKSATPVAGGKTALQLQILAPEPFLVSSNGGLLTLGTGATLQFPANAFLKDGAPFSGNVTVLARHISPDRPDYSALFPGGPAAQRTDGSATMLTSFGVISVELTDDHGTPVTLAPNKRATLVYPVPPSMLAAISVEGVPPATIPLWYFDEVKGLWIEEGAATLNGGMYVGTVAHFTPWNLDLPSQRAYVTGKVTCGGTPLAGVVVAFDQFSTTSQEDGTFFARIPSAFPTQVYLRDFAIASSEWTRSVASVPALAGEQSYSVGEVSPAACPVLVTGTLTDCANAPASGYLYAARSGNSSRVIPVESGTIHFLAPPGSTLSLSAILLSGPASTLSRTVGASGLDLGSLSVCDSVRTCSAIDSPMNETTTSVAISPDGLLTAIVTGVPGRCLIIDRATWSVIQDLGPCRSPYEVDLAGEDDAVGGVHWSPDARYLMNTGFYQGLTVITPRTGSSWSKPDISRAFFLDGGQTVVAVHSRPGYRVGSSLSILRADDGSVVRDLSFSTSWPQEWTLIGMRGEAAVIVVRERQGDGYASRVVLWSTTLDAPLNGYPLPGEVDLTTTTLTADGRTLLMDTSSNEITLVDTLAGTITTLPFAHEKTAPGQLSIAPDGRSLLAELGSPIGMAWWYSLPELQPIARLPGGTILSSKRPLLTTVPAVFYWGLRFTGGGRYATATFNNGGSGTRIWDLESCIAP